MAERAYWLWASGLNTEAPRPTPQAFTISIQAQLGLGHRSQFRAGEMDLLCLQSAEVTMGLGQSLKALTGGSCACCSFKLLSPSR